MRPGKFIIKEGNELLASQPFGPGLDQFPASPTLRQRKDASINHMPHNILTNRSIPCLIVSRMLDKSNRSTGTSDGE